MRSHARRYDMFMARPAAEIDPDSPTSSSSLILPGPIAPWLDRSIRIVTFAMVRNSERLSTRAKESLFDSGPLHHIGSSRARGLASSMFGHAPAVASEENECYAADP